jgi:soluble lytic murein transglycosylase-like protein
MTRRQVTQRVVLCAPATFHGRRTGALPSQGGARVLLTDPQNWASRRRISERNHDYYASPFSLAGVGAQGSSMALQQLSIAIDASPMLQAIKQQAQIYRKPLAGTAGFAAGAAMAVFASHIVHSAQHSVAAPAAMAAVAPSLVPATAPLVLAKPAIDVAAPALLQVIEVYPPKKAAVRFTDEKTIVVVAPPHESNVEGFNLDITSSNSLWAKAGARYHIDPALIYAVALVETRGVQPDGSVAPSPWVVRINGRLHNGSRSESEHAIELAYEAAVPVQDVGIMQVYYPMHRDIEPDPVALLNPARNIEIGTSLLHKAMTETSDPVLRIGYYHSHDVQLARGYGQTVLNVYRELKTVMGRTPTSAVALARVQSSSFGMHTGG